MGRLWDVAVGTAIAVYGLLFVFGVLITLLNAHVAHGFFYGTNYGEFYSERYVSQFWWALFFSASRLLTFMTVCLLYLWKDQRCCGDMGPRYLCLIFWWVVLIGLLAGEVLSFTMIAGYAGNANEVARSEPGQMMNPCDHPFHCCDQRVYSNPTNRCPNTSPCGFITLIAASFPMTDVCQQLLAFNVVFVLLHIWFAIQPLWMFGGCSSDSVAKLSTSSAEEMIMMDDLQLFKKTQ